MRKIIVPGLIIGLMLASLILTFNNGSGRQVRYTNSRFSFIYVLTTRTARPERINI
jgi:hypothetical protein